MNEQKDKQIIISVRFANYLLQRGHRLHMILKGKKEGKNLAFLFERTESLKTDMDEYTLMIARERERNSYNSTHKV